MRRRQNGKIVEAALNIYEYDSLIDDTPLALLMRGEIRGAQRMFLRVVEARFPSLLAIAQPLAARISSIQALDILVAQITKAPDENIARWLLTNFTVE